MNNKRNTIRRRINNIFRRLRVHGKYKDRLFRYLFREKKDLLELYNAVNGTNYVNEDELEITTLENVIYLSMKNDISFMFVCTMNLYEHQSTFNPNMPIRGVSYFARVYENYIKDNELDVYSSSPIRLPMPQFVVFYNGKKNEPDEVELRLSDLFMQSDMDDVMINEKAALECTARMINIKDGHSKTLLARCRRLREYTYFVTKVEYYLSQKCDLEEAVRFAIDDCIDSGVMKDVLSRFKNEVYDMFLTEYDEEIHFENAYKEGHREGLEEGQLKAKAVLLIKILECKGVITEPIKDKIVEEKNMTILDEWIEEALNTESVDKFIENVLK